MSTRNWNEVVFFTLMAFWPYILLVVGLLALLSRQRVLRGLIGVVLLLPSAYQLVQVWEHWAGIDARLFWMVPLTANVLVALFHLWWLWRSKQQ